MQVLKTEQEDGVVMLTISIAEDDHRFEVWADGDTAHVEYQETLGYRGNVFVSEPDDEIFRKLVTSDEMTEYLETYDCSKVTREHPS